MASTDSHKTGIIDPIDKEIRIMEIKLEHLDQGFLGTLDDLVAGTSSLDKFKAQHIFHEITANPLHRIFVAIMKEQGKEMVVGTITLIVEPKFIFNGGGGADQKGGRWGK